MNIKPYAPLLLGCLLLASGCALTQSQPSSPPAALTESDGSNWFVIYTNAVLDASNAAPDKVSTHLTAISLANTNLCWRTNAGVLQLKVATFLDHGSAERYYKPGPELLVNHDVWVTVCPDLARFCATNQSAGGNLLFRLNQLLGIPPGVIKDRVVEFWVSPNYLFRPTPEPAINSVSAGLSSSVNAPLVSGNLRTPAFWPAWYNGNYSTRYAFAKGITNAYPYTQLGYTYDWATNNPGHQGLSEFVIPCSALWSSLGVTVPIDVITNEPAVTYGE